MPEEIRVPQADWPERCKQLHREGLTVRAMRTEGDEFVVEVVPRVETRVERPDLSGGASAVVA